MKITVQNYRKTQTKYMKAKKGYGWTKLERIEMDCIWVNLKNVGPPSSIFFKRLKCVCISEVYKRYLLSEKNGTNFPLS